MGPENPAPTMATSYLVSAIINLSYFMLQATQAARDSDHSGKRSSGKPWI
jgi:hypothetical protein